MFHHGWPLSVDDWDNQMLFFLSKGYRVVAHDRRGHGRSDQTDTSNEMDTYAADVAALVRELDLKDAVHGRHKAHFIAGDPPMKVRKISISDAEFERSPNQDGGIFAGNVVDQRHGGPITIGYGRYDPNQSLTETIAVHDVMIVIEGSLSVESDSNILTAGPGEIIYMPEGESVTIRSHEHGAVTAYVTYPHWQDATSEADAASPI